MILATSSSGPIWKKNNGGQRAHLYGVTGSGSKKLGRNRRKLNLTSNPYGLGVVSQLVSPSRAPRTIGPEYRQERNWNLIFYVKHKFIDLPCDSAHVPLEWRRSKKEKSKHFPCFRLFLGYSEMGDFERISNFKHFRIVNFSKVTTDPSERAHSSCSHWSRWGAVNRSLATWSQFAWIQRFDKNAFY